METYDIYEVYYHGKIDDNIDMKNGIDLFYFVRDNGDWDLVKTYNNEKSAYKMWDARWSKKAKTEKKAIKTEQFFACPFDQKMPQYKKILRLINSTKKIKK